jgi:tRNA A37 threonylcarbamoyladenosine biosynthesis protein TsaE
MKENNGIQFFESGSEKETEEFAERFSSAVKQGDIICFFGSVGAGRRFSHAVSAEGWAIRAMSILRAI